MLTKCNDCGSIWEGERGGHNCPFPEAKISDGNPEFKTFINAMSAGYHLAQCDIEPMEGEEWDRFVIWLERKGFKKK